MPELPEVETTRRSLAPLIGAQVQQVQVHNPALRWPVPADLHRLTGQTLLTLQRRSKYLLARFSQDGTLWHLGMSGSLTIHADRPGYFPVAQPRRKHDHLILDLAQQGQHWQLRYHDPRRFGCCLWLDDEDSHPLLTRLGPEPLSVDFTPDYLLQTLERRTAPVKSVLMDNAVVVGVGNIYATEALFQTGIHPARPAHGVTAAEADLLVKNVRQILQTAIDLGGTTLRDYVNGFGENGYFQQTLQAYGRAGEPCIRCQQTLQTSRIGQRASVYCPVCQPACPSLQRYSNSR